MKWFKLMTDFDDDEKIESLTRIYGFAGQGRLLKIYRIIAKQMNDSDRCTVTYSPGFWTRQLGFRSVIDCRSFLDRLAIDWRLISVQLGNDWSVTCDKLLKIRDHRIKNRVHKSAPDTEADTEVRIRTPIVPKRDDKEFQEFWNEYPRKIGRAKVEKIWQKIMRDNMNSKAPIDLAHKIIESVKAQKKTNQLGNPDQNFVPHPSTWLNQKRWQDEIETKRLNGSGSTIDDGEGEWSKIVEHIRRKGTSQRIEGISDRTRTALNAIGGMSYLGMARTDQMPFIKKDFKIKYMEVGK